MPHFQNCTEVTPLCPVQATTYGYAPNYGITMTLVILFALCAILQLGFGLYHRAWTFTLALFGGCVMEAIGHVGRLMMHSNPWSDNAFRIQICCLILAPSFIAAGIYLSLKHIVLYVGPEASRIKPRLYTWLFIGADVASIFVQAAGGGIAAAADKTNRKAINLGNDLMIAGIGIQVGTMGICGLLALDYIIRYKRSGASGSNSPYQSAKANGLAPPINHNRFRIFCVVEILAYIFVLIRCIYRLPEMAGGWGNPLMRNQAEFLVLDAL
ncbi:RTA1-domain-containing protein [Myriangium duriaei CBS 260.36]|uniref:RTA1-domain-containing protein n=1 Tax=Myriangium duriaei CBS 260.36 TaxID=1168546 RepID=A0A9P4MLR5_9PEZI|nr:RTA1-domain-containing protein [Myriangium duriaei CBS 260.36]